jgi:hypothetical protein
VSATLAIAANSNECGGGERKKQRRSDKDLPPSSMAAMHSGTATRLLRGAMI